MEIEYKRKRTLNHRAERAYGYRSNLLMMDIKYDFKANPFKEKDGKPVLYPAVEMCIRDRSVPNGFIPLWQGEVMERRHFMTLRSMYCN